MRLDFYTRWGLILAGAFGSYSLGANNIGNVMGVFVSSSPFTDFRIGDLVTLTSVQQLFLLGGIAIAVGVFTYSKRVMLTVGGSLFPLNPVGAWVVVVAHSIVLFLFSSVALENFLANRGLPIIPLIPVSSSQAVVGAVIGIGLLKGAKGIRLIRWRVLLNIASGWVSTPIIAATVCFFLLFVLQNVFNQKVYLNTYFKLSQPVVAYLQEADIPVQGLDEMVDKRITGGVRFRSTLREHVILSGDQEQQVIAAAEIYRTQIDEERLEILEEVEEGFLSDEQQEALENLEGRSFEHKWQLREALAEQTEAWKKKPATTVNKLFNREVQEKLDVVYETFHVVP